eukprot:995924-Prorocentrum_minimum.AAC.1
MRARERCEGRIRRCEGRIRRCEGRIRRCEGRIQRCEERIRRCGGRIQRCEGRIQRCEGRIQVARIGGEDGREPSAAGARWLAEAVRGCALEARALTNSEAALDRRAAALAALSEHTGQARTRATVGVGVGGAYSGADAEDPLRAGLEVYTDSPLAIGPHAGYILSPLLRLVLTLGGGGVRGGAGGERRAGHRALLGIHGETLLPHLQ